MARCKLRAKAQIQVPTPWGPFKILPGTEIEIGDQEIVIRFAGGKQETRLPAGNGNIDLEFFDDGERRTGMTAEG